MEMHLDGGVSVVVPVFNSGTTLPQLVVALLDGLSDVGGHEIVLVDDGSADDSWKVIQALSDEHPSVRGIRLTRNVGEQGAVLCGIVASERPTIVTIDDDLQQSPGSIPDLLMALTDDTELVYGVPERDRHGPGRRLAAGVTKPVLEHVFRVPGAASTSAFRAFRADLRSRFPPTPGPLCSIDGMLRAATTDVAVVRVPHRPRRAGRSQYTLTKLVTHTMSVIAGGSAAPLLFATATGSGTILAAVVGVLAVVVGTLAGWVASPFPWLLVCIGGALLGLVLLALGILGELVARVLLRAGGQPAFVIGETTSPDT